MKVAFPITDNYGLGSRVFGHFGSAPAFLVVDTVTNEVAALENGASGQHRGCEAVSRLQERGVDAVVVGGIGGGALQKLAAMRVRVFQAKEGTVEENLALFIRNQLPEMAGPTCGSHGGHHHGHHGHS